MELILISNTKLKIMLNEDDMQQYKIGNDSDCAEPATRHAIRSLLERAREQIGFNTEGEEIFVQLYTSKRGGCELFVTKCANAEPADSLLEEVKKQIPSERLSTDKRGKKASHLPDRPQQAYENATLPIEKEMKKVIHKQTPSGRIAFSFPDCQSLISVCRILQRMEFRSESRAFTDHEGNCYLLLLNTGMSAFARLDRLTFILEYGKRENPDCLTSYISEHGKVICNERAIETLCRF